MHSSLLLDPPQNGHVLQSSSSLGIDRQEEKFKTGLQASLRSTRTPNFTPAKIASRNKTATEFHPRTNEKRGYCHVEKHSCCSRRHLQAAGLHDSATTATLVLHFLVHVVVFYPLYPRRLSWHCRYIAHSGAMHDGGTRHSRHGAVSAIRAAARARSGTCGAPQIGTWDWFERPRGSVIIITIPAGCGRRRGT